GGQIAVLQACRTSSPWRAAAGGTWSEAPQADCSTSVSLARDSSGVWQADLMPLLAGKTGTASVVIVPGASSTGVPGAFELDFTPPVIHGDAAPASSPTAGAESVPPSLPSTADTNSALAAPASGSANPLSSASTIAA